MATRERKAKAALVRVVLGPDRKPFVDLLGRAPGRAVYVEPDRALLTELLSPKGLERAFKGAAVPLEADEVERVLAETVARLDERLVELVCLARRAGKLDMGMESVLRAAARDPGVVIVAARDLAERSSAMLPVGSAGSPVRVGTKVEIGARLGREELGVVAIHPSVLAGRVILEAARRDGLLSSSTNAVSRGRVRSARKREQD